MEAYTELRQHRVDLKKAIPLPKPFTLLFDPASICNFRCVQCFRSVEGVEKWIPAGLMDFEKFKAVIDGLKAWEGPKIKVIRVIGFGEPFVNPCTPDMVRYIKNAQVADRVEITTNGSLITEAIAEQLVDTGLDYIRISIYSVIQERHEYITGNKMDIRRIYENVRALREIRDRRGAEKPFIYVKMLDSSQAEENQAFLKLYQEIADEAAIEHPHNWLDMEDKSFISDLYGGACAAGQDPTAAKTVCPQPFKMLSIRQNGDVVVCDPDWMGNTTIGNAFQTSLKDLWHSQALMDFWKMQIEGRRFQNESCRRCTTFLSDAYTVDNIDGITVEQLEGFSESEH